MNNHQFKPVSNKFKASNFHADGITIGNWQHNARKQGELTAKIYYSGGKLIWEILDGALKKKIEIGMANIVGIRAILADQQPGILKIELKDPPSFHVETNQQPKKATRWKGCADFTWGSASSWRIHSVIFPPGVLDKHYYKLLESDKRLDGLSQLPFPSLESPEFNPSSSSAFLSVNGNENGSRSLSVSQYPSYGTLLSNIAAEFHQNSMLSDTNQQFLTQNQNPWNQDTNFPDTHQIADNNQYTHPSNYNHNWNTINHIQAPPSVEFDLPGMIQVIQPEVPQELYESQGTRLMEGHSLDPFEIPMTQELGENGVVLPEVNNAIMGMPTPELDDEIWMRQIFGDSISGGNIP